MQGIKCAYIIALENNASHVVAVLPALTANERAFVGSVLGHIYACMSDRRINVSSATPKSPVNTVNTSTSHTPAGNPTASAVTVSSTPTILSLVAFVSKNTM